MKLVLVRHGETKEEKEGVILGHLPGSLSKEGNERAKKIAEAIRSSGLQPEIIISSDLARAADYAEIIGRELRLKIDINPLARERSAGVAEGKTQDEIDWEEYEKTERPLRKHTGGESFEEVRERARSFLKEIESSPFRTLILVSHSVFLGMLAMEVCDWTMDEALACDFRNPLLVDTKKKEAELLPPRS